LRTAQEHVTNRAGTHLLQEVAELGPRSQVVIDKVLELDSLLVRALPLSQTKCRLEVLLEFLLVTFILFIVEQIFELLLVQKLTVPARERASPTIDWNIRRLWRSPWQVGVTRAQEVRRLSRLSAPMRASLVRSGSQSPTHLGGGIVAGYRELTSFRVAVTAEDVVVILDYFLVPWEERTTFFKVALLTLRPALVQACVVWAS